MTWSRPSIPGIAAPTVVIAIVTAIVSALLIVGGQLVELSADDQQRRDDRRDDRDDDRCFNQALEKVDNGILTRTGADHLSYIWESTE